MKTKGRGIGENNHSGPEEEWAENGEVIPNWVDVGGRVEVGLGADSAELKDASVGPGLNGVDDVTL